MTAEHYDVVQKPAHYNIPGKMECIDLIKEHLSDEEFAGFLRGNVFKYTHRYKGKNGIEDLLKAEWYLKRLEQHTSQKNKKSAVLNHIVDICSTGWEDRVVKQPGCAQGGVVDKDFKPGVLFGETRPTTYMPNTPASRIPITLPEQQ